MNVNQIWYKRKRFWWILFIATINIDYKRKCSKKVKVNQNVIKSLILLSVQPWSWRGPWVQGWLTHSASLPAHPAVWGFLSCSPAGGDTDQSSANGFAAAGMMKCKARGVLTVKTLSGSPRARMFVSWMCLSTIQASSCLPIWGIVNIIWIYMLDFNINTPHTQWSGHWISVFIKK